MAARARLTDIFDEVGIPAMLARRRIAARLCMGQSVFEMARLEGVSWKRMQEIMDHPAMVRLAKTWMAYLRRIQDDRDLAVLEGHALRLSEHELETGNGPCANLISKLWAFCGSPARGIMEMVARRFCALAERCMVRRRIGPDPYADLEPPPPPEPEPTPEQVAARQLAREQMRQAKEHGWSGALDLRWLPRSWGRGVKESLFRKFAAIVEARHEILLRDPMRFPKTRPDPGPFFRPLGARVTIWAEPGATEFRFVEEGMPGACPGAFQVWHTGRVLPTSTDLALRKVELAYEPWCGIPDPPDRLTGRAKRWIREQARKAELAAAGSTPPAEEAAQEASRPRASPTAD